MRTPVASAEPTAPGPAALVEALDRAGHRRTAPRVAVVELVAAREGHFTAGALVDEARRLRPAIGRATVFRTLDLLASLGLVERVDLPGGEHAYVVCEAAHHHHAICTVCGRAEDVDEAGLAEVLERIAERTGFLVATHRLELFGLCPACRSHGERAAPGG